MDSMCNFCECFIISSACDHSRPAINKLGSRFVIIRVWFCLSLEIHHLVLLSLLYKQNSSDFSLTIWTIQFSYSCYKSQPLFDYTAYRNFLLLQNTMINPMTIIPKITAPPTPAPIATPLSFPPFLASLSPGPSLVGRLDSVVGN